MNSKNFIIKQLMTKAEFIIKNTENDQQNDVDINWEDARELALMVVKYLENNHG